MSRRIIVAEDSEGLSRLAASVMIDKTCRAIKERGRALVLVSGGTSVWKTYELYGASDLIDWTKVFFFWGDDRFVEPENPYSNFAQVRDSLFAKAKGLPQENIFPINYKASSPMECASQYSRTIQEFFGISDGEWPVFDLAQIGMGADGHTASIFPDSPATFVVDEIAVMNHAGLKPWVDRITLTMPVFNHTRHIVFITSGPSKTATLRTVIEGETTVQEMPAAHVGAGIGEVLWLVDKVAAAELTVPIETSY